MRWRLLIAVLLVVALSDTQRCVAQTASPELAHSPRKAILLSILPGAGQVYNGQAWKIPVIYGLFTATGYYMYSNYHHMVDFREEYLHRVNGGTPELEGYTTYPDNSIYNYYISYNQSFQLSIILTAVIYALNLVDAYVYGHLYDFQITDDISLALQPTIMPMPSYGNCAMPALSCSLRF